MAAYELKYTAEEIDGILESVEEKTIYDDATQKGHGLMSAADKSKLDELPDGRILSEAFDSKVDKKIPSMAGNLAKITGEGNMADSGYSIDDFATEQQGRLADTAYQKPSSGIPKTDLASSVQTSLGKADTALQEHQDISGKQDTLVSGTNIKTVNGESLLGSGNIEIQGGGGEENVIEAITMNGAFVPVTNKTAAITETDPTVPSWAKQSTKPSYNYSEIGNTPDLSGYATTQDLDNAIENTSYYTYVEDEGGVLGDDTERPIRFIQAENSWIYAIGEQNSGGMEDAILATTNYVDNAVTTLDQDIRESLADVATSGSYNDLDDKPTIPQPEVFWAEYGVTTASDILTALSNNKVVACYYNNIIHYYMNNDSTYLFFGSTYGASGSYVRIRISDSVYNRYSFGYESNSNKVSTITGNETKINYYPNTKAVADYVDSICGNIQTILTTI